MSVSFTSWYNLRNLSFCEKNNNMEQLNNPKSDGFLSFPMAFFVWGGDVLGWIQKSDVTFIIPYVWGVCHRDIRYTI